MSVSKFSELLEHVGHNLVCVAYAGEQEAVANVAIECETCNEVLIDFDREVEAKENARSE